MPATGGSAVEWEATNEEKRQDIDTAPIAAAATWASPNPAPATKATITRLYSMSLPVFSV